MKQFAKEFLRRGLVSAFGGPLVLAVIYFVLGETGVVSALTTREVSLGILSITLLAMTAGGMSAIYQMERLPLLTAILIHGAGLYGAYILVYLINGWLQQTLVPILVFTAVFFLGYALIWGLIYVFAISRTRRLNEKLRQRNP